MHIFIATVGTRGDVQPFVALGIGLQQAGHKVTLCTSERFERFVREHGLLYGYMSNDLLDLMDSQAGKQAMEETVGVFGFIKSTLKLFKKAKAINQAIIEDSWQAAQQAKPDLIIYHPKVISGVHLAEKLQVPVMMGFYLPLVIPTNEMPAAGLPSLPLGPWYNRLTYAVVHKGFTTYNGIVKEFRKTRLNLPAFPTSSGVLKTASGTPIPVLHAFSPSLIPPPSDWPAHAHTTGFWFLERQEDWQPPEALQTFLESGPPPVYVGFGSISGKNPEKTTRIIVDALQEAGVRGIVATGWGGLKVDHLPDTILRIDQAPHDWLFPRMAAVVHHGGAGTTAAGLRAGRPTIICPFFGDQPFWGKTVHALGVGSKPIPQKKLTVPKLAAAIREVTTSTSIQQKAEQLGTQIRAENGVQEAVDIILSYLNSPVEPSF